MASSDIAQGVFQRGFDADTLDETWTRCQLVDNCRNTYRIASILHRRLDGATPLAGPESLGVRGREAADSEHAIHLGGGEIDHIESEGYEIPRVLRWASARGVSCSARRTS